MGKLLKIFGRAVMVPLLYLSVTVAVVSLVSVYYMAAAFAGALINNGDEAQTEELMTAAMSEITGLTTPILLASAAVCLLILYASYRKKSYGLWEAVRLAPTPANLLGLSAVSGFGYYLACVGILSVIPLPESWLAAHDTAVDALISDKMPVLSILVTVIVAPFIEEIVFRGFAHRILARELPLWVAAFVSGALFGLYHFNYLQTVYAFLMGILLGLIYTWTKSLWAVIAFHVAFNLSNFVMIPIFAAFGEEESLLLFVPMIIVGVFLSAYGTASLRKRAIAQPE